MNIPTVDRFAGCLVGQCLADAAALGAAGLPGETCREYWRESLQNWWNDFQDRRYPGELQFAEGAQLAVAMFESFVECRGFDPAAFAARVAQLCGERRIMAKRYETYKAAKNLQRGAAWNEAGIDAPGLGAAMRAGPMGLFFFNDPIQLRQAVANQGRITHRNNVAIAAAMVVAETVRRLICLNEVDRDSFLEELADCTQTLDGEFAQCLRELRLCFDLSTEQAASRICATAPADPFSNAPGGVPSHARPAVLWSLYAFLKMPRDFSRSLELALYPGGEVICTASIVGALYGALGGLDRLPKRPCQQLVNGNTRILAQLVELATASHKIVVDTLQGTRSLD